MRSGRQVNESARKDTYDLIKKRLFGELCLIAIGLVRIATDNTIRNEFPEIAISLKTFEDSLKNDDAEDVEEALSGLYVRLHNLGSTYTQEEREVIQKKGGYHCYPGGLSPILLARNFISRDSVVVDLGSGNGLQGLLLQQIYPHKKTIQIEISGEMIRVGRLYQNALGIEDKRIEWVNKDILNASYDEADFIYIYRPARPVEGKDLYKSIAGRLLKKEKKTTIFSVADCLAPLIAGSFNICYDDGHLKIFVNYRFSCPFSVSVKKI